MYSNNEGTLSSNLQQNYETVNMLLAEEAYFYERYLNKGDGQTYYVDYVIKSLLQLVNTIGVGMYQSSNLDSNKNNIIFNSFQQLVHNIFMKLPMLLAMRGASHADKEILVNTAKIFNLKSSVIEGLGLNISCLSVCNDDEEVTPPYGEDVSPASPSKVLSKRYRVAQEKNRQQRTAAKDKNGNLDGNLSSSKGSDAGETGPLIHLEPTTFINHSPESVWQLMRTMLDEKSVREIVMAEYGTLSETIIDFANCFDKPNL
jgi:hypothetical protein